jgi:hypothetical protein
VTFGIERMEVLGEPGMGSLERKLGNGHLDALERPAARKISIASITSPPPNAGRAEPPRSRTLSTL